MGAALCILRFIHISVGGAREGDSILAGRGAGGDPRAGGRQRGARDGAGAVAIPSRARLAGVRRGGGAHQEEAVRGGSFRCGGRAFPVRREDGLRPLPQLLRLESRVREPGRGLRGRGSSSRSRTCRSRSPITARTPTSRRSSWTSGAARRRRTMTARRSKGRSCWLAGRSPRAPARLRGARRRRLPLGLPQPDDRMIGRRPGPRTLGPSLSLSDREPIRLHAVEAAGRRSPGEARRGREDHTACAGRRENGPGHVRRRRRDDPRHGSGRRRSRPDRPPLPRIRGGERQRLRQRQSENEPVRPAEISEYLDLLAKAKIASFR